jgi:pyruvate/2-oxoglutarate dehydrogenase complex dihydrolipoamide acyltransferase (E2) component
MAEVLLLPRLGETMDSGRVVSWQKKPGEGFRRGETIVEVESDKTVVELPALVGGILVEILAAEGDDIPVGAPLCRYERADAREPGPSNAAAPPRVERERGPARRATPAARSLARKHGSAKPIFSRSFGRRAGGLR